MALIILLSKKDRLQKKDYYEEESTGTGKSYVIMYEKRSFINHAVFLCRKNDRKGGAKVCSSV